MTLRFTNQHITFTSTSGLNVTTGRGADVLIEHDDGIDYARPRRSGQ